MSSQYSILMLLLPSWISVNQYPSSKSRDSSRANALTNVGLIVHQCLEPSVCLSLDHNDAAMFVTILGTEVAKYPPSGECAWMTLHFLLLVGMVLRVYRDALWGGLLKELSQDSLLRELPFLSSHGSLFTDPWSSVSTSFLNALLLLIFQHKMCTLDLQLMKSQLLFHIRQEFSQYGVPKLVQWWCLQE